MRSKIAKILNENACSPFNKKRRPYWKIKFVVESELMFKIALRNKDDLITLFSCFFGRIDEVNEDEESISIYKYSDLSKPDSVFACMYVRFSS